MKVWRAILLVLSFVLVPVDQSECAVVYVDPLPIAQGQPAVVRACLGTEARSAYAVFLGQKVFLVHGRDGCFYGAVAADLRTKPGRYPLRVYTGERQAAAARIEVVSKDYGERRISVDRKFTKLTPAQLERYKRETARIKAVYNNFTPIRYWDKGFIRPLDGTVVSPFGRRSIVNGVEKSPHSGVDLRGSVGTPVKAAASGRVALVLDTYFGGLTILIDHGLGLVTRYLHLSAALVQEGQMVDKGQVIAKVGNSGRVTGSHLDFGVRWGDVRVDPMAWIQISGLLARRLGVGEGS